jgi:hypothetical protein
MASQQPILIYPKLSVLCGFSLRPLRFKSFALREENTERV